MLALLLAASLFWRLAPIANAIEIPRGLTSADRTEVTKMLGSNTSSKLLTNPYPLGGYSGFEAGVSIEVINIEDLKRLGLKSTNDEREFRYAKVSVGKGLYNDIDVFFHFVPPTAGIKVSEYGGLLRWSFFQAKFVPINISWNVHLNHININDSFSNQTAGTNLVSGINVQNFSIYFGIGYLESRGTFMGGTTDQGVVDPSDPDFDQGTFTASSKVRQFHSQVGITVHFSDYFLAAQIDRYQDPVYSMKLGTRL